jgi:hypothetical protein
MPSYFSSKTQPDRSKGLATRSASIGRTRMGMGSITRAQSTGFVKLSRSFSRHIELPFRAPLFAEVPSVKEPIPDLLQRHTAAGGMLRPRDIDVPLSFSPEPMPVRSYYHERTSRNIINRSYYSLLKQLASYRIATDDSIPESRTRLKCSSNNISRTSQHSAACLLGTHSAKEFSM